MSRYTKISVAVPVLDELENIQQLVSMLRTQSVESMRVLVCVNHPESWRTLPASDWRRNAVDNNIATIDYLHTIRDLDIEVIDVASKGYGWSDKRQGVGFARQKLFDRIKSESSNKGLNELVVSLDADTAITSDYLSSVLQFFNSHTSAVCACMPYLHQLCGDSNIDRNMLRYECYMRHYLINLLLIKSPYAFTALGSAMVFPLWAYCKAGGMTPLQAGEDFYMVQKFAKIGQLLLPYQPSLTVKPQGRLSRRVPFGTGPAIALAMSEMESKYPFYSRQAFSEIQQTYKLLPSLYERDVETPMSEFLRQQFKTNDLWSPLRRNFKTVDRFVHACHERIDGLRILQFLRSRPYQPEVMTLNGKAIDFATDPVSVLEKVRNALLNEELMLREELFER